MGEKTLAILSYHKIGYSPPTWNSWYYVSPGVFREHLWLLREQGYQIVDLQTLLTGLADVNTFDERTAVITFDDGYRSVRELALPILREMDAPAIVFVPATCIGGLNSFDEERQPDEPICDVNDLRALESGGVAVQSHGLTHRAFSAMGSMELQHELAESKRVLERFVAHPVETISFPYGDGGADTTLTGQLLRTAGYRAAFEYKGGPTVLPVKDVMRLPRLAMGPDSDLEAMLHGRGVS